MSHVVGTGTVVFGRGGDRPRGVSVAACGVAACRAFEGTDTQCVVVSDPLGPDAGVVGVLSGGLLRDPGGLPLRLLVALRRGVSPGTPAAGHPALGLGQLGSTAAAVAEVRQVERRVGRGGGGRDAPVDADTRRVRFGCGGDLTADHERGVPVAEGVLVAAHAGRFGRQVPRPDDGDRHFAGQAQPAATLRRRSRGMSRTNATCDQTPNRLDGERAIPELLRRGSVSSPRLQPWVSTEDIR